MVLGLRTFVMAAMIAAIAGIQFYWLSDRVTVLYLLDQSDSIPALQQERMFRFVVETVQRHRDSGRQDQAGMIVFAADAAIEVPPAPYPLPLLRPQDCNPGRPDATNLEAAFELALAVMPEGSRRRIVLVSDGNQNLGEVGGVMSRVAAAGIGVDVLAIPPDGLADVLVEKIDLPGDVRRGQKFEARVVLTAAVPAERSRSISGRLSVTRQSGGAEQLLVDEKVTLSPGKNVFPFITQNEEVTAYTYSATFVADSPADDAIAQNNTAITYSLVRGKGRVLLVEPWDSPGQYQLLVDSLRKAELEVVVQGSDSLYGSLADLQPFDAVILAGVPRLGGGQDNAIIGFTDNQIELLVGNTQQLGCGLLMLGGPEALGAGGWAGTKLEEAMPVDFDIKNQKVSPVGALQLVIDSSGSMAGENMALCKAAAMEAVKALQPSDYIGVIHFDSQPHEIVPMQKVAGRTHILPRIASIQAGGGTDVYPAMQRGYFSLRNIDASTKHMIVLTDGLTPEADFTGLVRKMRDDGITVSGVAVGEGADVNLMLQIAAAGGGNHYYVKSARAVPRILVRESRRVRRGLIHENPSGIDPVVEVSHPIVGGLGPAPPPITGFVMTTPKVNPLVQTVMTSPLPTGQDNALLACWQYGLGRTAVWSTDAGQRWTTAWASWPGFDKFFEQLLRWLMRPTGTSDQWTIATQYRDGQVRVVATALDPENQAQSVVPMQATVLVSDLNPVSLQMRPVTQGRYVGTFPAVASGAYFVNVIPGGGSASLVTGVSVPYSDEYRLRELNEPLLGRLAAIAPRGGISGEAYPPLTESVSELAAQINPFRSGLTSDKTIRDIWTWAVLLACSLFWIDIFTRRVAISFGWAQQAWNYVRRQHAPEPAPLQRLDSLRASMQAARSSRAATAARFEPLVNTETLGRDRTKDADGSTATVQPPSIAGGPTATAEDIAQPSYTERLLEAKRKAKHRSS